jgi:hypothetical protein
MQFSHDLNCCGSGTKPSHGPRAGDKVDEIFDLVDDHLCTDTKTSSKGPSSQGRDSVVVMVVSREVRASAFSQ